MNTIQLREQLDNKPLSPDDTQAATPFIEDGQEISFCVKRHNVSTACLKLSRANDTIMAKSSYFIGLDWIKDSELAVQVNCKMNDTEEIDCIKMLNESLNEPENFGQLQDLLTIHFHKPSIRITQKDDLLSIFLVVEYLRLLRIITRKGLKKSYYTVRENLTNKIKGKLLVGQNIRENLMKGRLTNNVCQYQVYDVDTPENRILKKALLFCIKQIGVYSGAGDMKPLKHIATYVKPYFERVGNDISVQAIKTHKGNPVFKEHNKAIELAQLILRRYSYDITKIGDKQIDTPPYWIDMSKLFELYVFHHLRKVFTGKDEVRYHVEEHGQELDYLLKPRFWANPYVIDAKYKPRYKDGGGIDKEDARQVSGYARLKAVYKDLNLPEDAAPIKCLIVYPDQEQEEKFCFTRETEPTFDAISGYVRMYKVSIRLPVVES
jgi:5-methylcytosine-specific restriction enzyme subunit McrC